MKIKKNRGTGWKIFLHKDKNILQSKFLPHKETKKHLIHISFHLNCDK